MRAATQRLLFVVIVIVLAWPHMLRGERRPIDVARSKLSVQVFKSGLFSAFAHNHEIEAPIAEGNVDTSANVVTLRIEIRKLRVTDPEASAETRAEIQRTMESPMVLDVERFPEIAFESTGVEFLGEEGWRVHDNLGLHGKTAPVIAEVALKDGHYLGSATISRKILVYLPSALQAEALKSKTK